MGEILDLFGDCELGLVIEVSGERHHDQSASSVARAQCIGTGRPRVSHVDDTVQPRDRPKPISERGFHGRVVGVDTVGDDSDLAAGPGKVVELLGDAS